METVYSNLKKLRQQMGITESSSESESIYDTLEKVVEQQRQEKAKPSFKSVNKHTALFCLLYTSQFVCEMVHL